MDTLVQVVVVFFILAGLGFMLELKFKWVRPFCEWVVMDAIPWLRQKVKGKD